MINQGGFTTDNNTNMLYIPETLYETNTTGNAMDFIYMLVYPFGSISCIQKSKDLTFIVSRIRSTIFATSWLL